jgi:hypothetical protein
MNWMSDSHERASERSLCTLCPDTSPDNSALHSVWDYRSGTQGQQSHQCAQHCGKTDVLLAQYAACTLQVCTIVHASSKVHCAHLAGRSGGSAAEQLVPSYSQIGSWVQVLARVPELS